MEESGRCNPRKPHNRNAATPPSFAIITTKPNASNLFVNMAHQLPALKKALQQLLAFKMAEEKGAVGGQAEQPINPAVLP